MQLHIICAEIIEDGKYSNQEAGRIYKINDEMKIGVE